MSFLSHSENGLITKHLVCCVFGVTESSMSYVLYHTSFKKIICTITLSLICLCMNFNLMEKLYLIINCMFWKMFETVFYNLCNIPQRNVGRTSKFLFYVKKIIKNFRSQDFIWWKLYNIFSYYIIKFFRIQMFGKTL